MGKKNPTTHDLSSPYAGYAYTPYDGGQSGTVTNWSFHEIRKGDYLLLRHPNGGSSRYRVAKFKRYGDPPDMWTAEVVFDPRTSSTPLTPHRASAQD